MWYQRRDQHGIGIVVLDEEAPETVLGILPCSADGCSERTGVACVHVDARNRLCPSAWCPRHRVVVGAQPYCAVHAARHRAGEPEHDSGPAADLVERFARIAEDDVVSLLYGFAQRNGGTLCAEPLRTDFSNGESWLRKGWRIESGGGELLRIDVSASTTRPDQLSVLLDGHPVSVIHNASVLIGDELEAQRVVLSEVYAPLGLAIDLEHGAMLTGSGQRSRSGSGR